MADADLPHCRSCGSRLRFVRMATGKAMPCNPVGDRTGNVAALKTPPGYAEGVVLTHGEPAPDCDGRKRNAKPVAPADTLF